MTVRVRLFGPMKDAAGCGEVCVEGPEGTTCAQVICLLSDASPALQGMLPSCRLAVNGEFASPETAVRPDDEVALIGMVSGG